MLPKGTKLLKTTEEIHELVFPMIEQFCESINHKESVNRVTDIILDLDNIHCFLFVNGSDPIGFTTYSIANAFGIKHLHQWHGYFLPEQRHHSGRLYDLTENLVQEMNIESVSFTFFNKKIAKRVSQQLKKRGIDLKFKGYYYEAKQKE